LLLGQDGDYWLERDPAETQDPDELEEWLAVVSVYTGHVTDAYWRLVVEIDIAEKEKWRRRQKMFLARYGRQSLLQWDDVEVAELDHYTDDLIELLKLESHSDDLKSG
jgi:hypothetical protein